MEVLPHALDAVGVGAVGREKVKHDATAQGSERVVREMRGADAVVVDDEMNPSSASVLTREEPEQLAEERHDATLMAARNIQSRTILGFR